MEIDFERILRTFITSIILGMVIKAVISPPDTWELAKLIFSEIRKVLRGY
jgi:hypothetical protein